MAEPVKVECAPLADGSLSIRVDGKEVHILPPKAECDASVLELAFREVLEEVLATAPETSW